MADRKVRRRLLAGLSVATFLVSGALMVVFVALDNSAGMLASAGVFLGSCVAFVKIVGPAVGATD